MFLEHAFDRLGRLVYRGRWGVLVVCMAIAGLSTYAAKDVQDVLYGSTVEIAGTPSHDVALALRTQFNDPFAELAVVTTESRLHTVEDTEYAKTLVAFESALRADARVKKVLGYVDKPDARMRSADGHYSLILVGLTAANVQEGERATPGLRAAISLAGKRAVESDPTFRWATTGRGALAYDLGQYGAKDTQAAEARVLPLTLVILLVAFGALIAALIPLAMGLLTTLVTLGLIAVIARHIPLGNMVQNVSTMVGLAVGIDYSLIMLGRFREALGRGATTEDAVAECMRTAGVSVACSGFTVMIGLAGLGLTPSLDLRSIGLGGALVLMVGVSLALTLLPAVLSVLGPWVDAPRGLARWLRPWDPAPGWARWARLVMAHPWPFATAGLVLLGLACSPLLAVKTDFPGSRWIPAAELEFHHGLDMLEAMGRKNASTPVDLLVTSQNGPVLAGKGLEGLFELSKRLHSDSRILAVIGPVDLGLKPDAYRKLYRNWQALQGLDPERFGMFLSRDGRQALIQVVARNGVTYEGIKDLARELAAQQAPVGVTVAVGGQAAFANDLYDVMKRSLPGMFSFVVGATFLLLALTYRSWLVPLKATVLNLLSVGAGCGALVMIFQWGWGKELLGLTEVPGGIPLAVLVMIFCVVFGLSMDYEVFLLGRIHEVYQATGDNARATEEGLAATGSVITSAALIMVTVFGGFALAKLVVVKMLGAGLGLAVIVDATIVRILLAPAIMKLAGDWNWYPGSKRRPPAP